jgi:hypothetical protein
MEMKKKQFIATIAISALVLGSAQAADITNLGTSTPSTNGAIAAHSVAAGTEGNREVRWTDAANHSLGGQRFVATKTALAKSVTLKVRSTETWSNWTINSFKIKVFKGVGDGVATLLGTYAYDATSLDASPGSWVEFAFGSGLTLTNGTEYCFMVVCGEEDADHRINFGRDSSSTGYADGNELRGANAYDIFNFETDPWDVADPIGSTVNLAQTGDMLFLVNELLTENVAPVADDINKSTLKNVPATITLSGSDTNGDSLTFAVQSSPTNGTLSGTEPNLTYTPNTNYYGLDSFTYTANDGITNSVAATVSITVLESSGLVASVGADDPAIANTNLIGTAAAGFSRETIRTDTQTFVIGQSFTLAEAQTVTEIYLQSATGEDFINHEGGVEIKVFSGTGGSATLLDASYFDAEVNNGDGNEVEAGDWVRFSLQDGGVSLPAGENSFLVHWSQKGVGNKWEFARNKTAGSYSGGVQYEFISQSGDAYPQWDSDPWVSVIAISDNNLTFYINTGDSTVTPSELYATWAGANGANVADMLDDTDFDGMTELLEYALGGNPTTNDAAAILPTSEAAGDWMYYIYNRRDDAADRGLTYEVLSSTDLVFGPITNATAEVGASTAVGGFESVTNRVSTTTEGKQFMNLNVELAD